MVWTCPLCGKEYSDQVDLPAHIRLARHLTGKHCLKGSDFQKAMREADLRHK